MVQSRRTGLPASRSSENLRVRPPSKENDGNKETGDREEGFLLHEIVDARAGGGG